MHLFRNRYRIESTRMPNWDYTFGRYFITICTKHREPFFGHLIDNDMVLSIPGIIVRDEWIKTSLIRPDVVLDGFVVMPDHFHGIIMLHPPDIENISNAVETPGPGVSTGTGVTGTTVTTGMHKPQWQSQCLGAIMNQFKRACTVRIRNAGLPHFAWQTRFYDRIIRHEQSLHALRHYIGQNPMHWKSK